MSNENKLVKLSDLGAVAAELEAEITALDNGKADVIISTASGPVASFSDGADGLPVEDLIIAIEPVQSGSGDPSPSNVRPISGWTGANIYSEAEYDAQADPAITVSWQTEAGTVYGGTLDVTTGVLTVDRATVTYNSSSGFEAHSSGRWYHNGTPSGYDNSVDKRNKAISNTRKRVGSYNYGPYFDFGSAGIYLNKLSESEDITALNSQLQSTPFVVCYYISSPQTYQLTAHELNTLLGDNNIWADCGPIEKLEYKANTGMYFDKKLAAICDCIAPTEDGATASQAYAQGKYFFHNGSFCKAKTAIASGATFTLGTNYEVTTVAAELYNALNT